MRKVSDLESGTFTVTVALPRPSCTVRGCNSAGIEGAIMMALVTTTAATVSNMARRPGRSAAKFSVKVQFNKTPSPLTSGLLTAALPQKAHR